MENQHSESARYFLQAIRKNARYSPKYCSNKDEFCFATGFVPKSKFKDKLPESNGKREMLGLLEVLGWIKFHSEIARGSSPTVDYRPGVGVYVIRKDKLIELIKLLEISS